METIKKPNPRSTRSKKTVLPQKLSITDSSINSQHSLPTDKKPKVQCLEEWFNFNLFEKTFMTNIMLERLAKELVDWARTNPDAIKVKQFVAEHGIGEATWHEWCNKYPILGNANRHALTIIGNRRELGAMRREFDAGVVNFMMPHYDPDWDSMLKRREELKKKDDQDTTQKIVVIDRVPDSPLVPRKKDED